MVASSVESFVFLRPVRSLGDYHKFADLAITELLVVGITVVAISEKKSEQGYI